MSDIATLAGGCFWCLEAVFQRLNGVESVVSGYMGGQIERPDYRQVCDGNTGHAEVVQIRFDPAIISYDTLLDVFFALHDPTTLNRQGNDVGTQYRSAIFFHTTKQSSIAQHKLISITEQYPAPIVTEITAATFFWPAETYHQNYFNQNAGQSYCALIIAPKVTKALHYFSALMRP